MMEQQKGNQREHLAGGRPWRWVFESLRAALEPASLVPNLLILTPNIVHCCSELPPQEVADDISLIVQAVSDRWLPVDCAESARICRLSCIFVRSVCERQQLEFNADSQLALLHFLQGTVMSTSAVILLGEEGVTEAGRAKVEAVAALGQVLLQVCNGGLLSMDGVSELVVFLSGLITYPVTPEPGRQMTSRSDLVAQHGMSIDEMEVQRLTSVALGCLLSQARPLVSVEAWTIVVQALGIILESIASKKALAKDYAACRYYVDLLRCVYTTVSEPEECLKEHVETFVIGLRMFFLYGVNVKSQDIAASSISWQEEKSPKLHLDLDKTEVSEVHTSGESECLELNTDSTPTFSFDTYESVGDALAEAALRDKSSELRLYSARAIQAMAMADPDSVKKWSGRLILADNVVQPRSDQATLLMVLLFDPIAKVRVAAASTLAFLLEVADHQELARRGLSDSERQILVALETGLVHAVMYEKHIGTLLPALKALSLYIATAPFSQLPSELLSNIVLSIIERLQEPSSFLNQSSIMIAAIACLKASLSISLPSAQLEAILLKEAPSGSGNVTHPRSLLFDLISYSQPPAPTPVQVEAILALKAAAHNYPGVVARYWNDIFKVVTQVIDSGLETRAGTSDDAHLISSTFARSVSSSGLVQTSRLSNDELVHTAIELLDDLLRVASDFEVPREARDDVLLKSPLSSQLPEAPEAPRLLCSPNLATHNNAVASESMRFERSEDDGSLQWLQALERLLPAVLRHSSSMVRGAALSCFAGLTPAVFCSLPAPKQEFILSAIMRASLYDETPAVQSAVCRAVGVIVGFPQVSKRNIQVASFMEMLMLRMEDSLAPGHISVSWALANLCDGLCTYCTMVDPVEVDNILNHLPLKSLLACIFKAAKDANVEVCINALRALGNLSRIVNFKTSPTSSQWLGSMLQTFQACGISENVEISRNSSIDLSTSPWAPSLFYLLQSLLRGSKSHEVQVHAAAALSALQEDYGTAFGDVLHILDSIDSADTISASELSDQHF